MGAVPLLSVVSAFSAEDGHPIPSFFVRKTAKGYGAQLKIEGMDDHAGESLSGKRVVLIDDVATSGGSILLAADEIAAAGGIMADAIVILDREARGITLMGSAEGGVDIEEVAATNPEASIRVCKGSPPVDT